MSKWLAYNSAQKTGTIVSKISTANQKQGISFRGHRENEESANKGSY